MRYCFLILSVLCFISCGRRIEGDGIVTDQVRETAVFHAIVLNIPAVVYLTDSSTHTFRISAEGNLLDEIVTRIDGETLVISSKGQLLPSRPIKIYITTNRISKIELNGSGELRSAGTIKTEVADLELNGSGHMVLDLLAVKIAAGMTGSGNLQLSGSCNDLELEIRGSGNADAARLNALGVKVKILGSGNASVNASETIKAKVNGSGMVNYSGTATVDKDIAGSGDVRKVAI